MHEQEQAGVGVTLATKTEDELHRSDDRVQLVRKVYYLFSVFQSE